MPFVSEAQRGLFYAAASRKGGAGGVSNSVAKDMIKDDKPGKLPKKKWSFPDKKIKGKPKDEPKRGRRPGLYSN